MKLLFSIFGTHEGKLYKLSSVKYTNNSIFYIHHLPRGYHITIHDASGENESGIVQARVQQGTFKIIPGDLDMGNKDVIKNIPRFLDIEEPIPIFDNLSITRPTSMIRGLKESQITKSGQIIIIDLNGNGDNWLGDDLALCGHSKVSSLPKFFADRLSTWARNHKVRQEQLFINSEITPAIAISFYSCEEKTV